MRNGNEKKEGQIERGQNGFHLESQRNGKRQMYGKGKGNEKKRGDGTTRETRSNVKECHDLQGAGVGGGKGVWGWPDPEDRCTRAPDSGFGHTPAKGAGGLDSKSIKAFIKIGSVGMVPVP
jgi:hypothetical protein